MAITPVPAVTPVPPFPALSDRVLGTYNSKAYNFGNHMSVTFMGELLAVATSAFNNATQAAADAATATAQAAAAIGVANAPKWVFGTTYAADVYAWSPTDKQTYRRNTPGVSTVDPSLDSTGWTRVGGGDSIPQFFFMQQGIV